MSKWIVSFHERTYRDWMTPALAWFQFATWIAICAAVWACR